MDKWKAVLTIDEYDHDFGCAFDGDYIEKTDTVFAFGISAKDAVLKLESRLTYFGAFFATFSDPRNPDKNTHAKQFQDNLLAVADAVGGNGQLAGECDGFLYAIDEGHWEYSHSGNREYDLRIVRVDDN